MKPRITGQLAYVIFVACFFPFWFLSSLLHLHEWRGLLLAVALSALVTWGGAPLWMKIYKAPKPSKKDFRNPRLGSRAERREMAKRHRSRR
jgi:hypothetical protein